MMINENDLSQIQGSVVIIPAAGVGKRFGADKPKQYQKLENKRVLDITLNLFLLSENIEKIVLIISPEDVEYKHLDSISNDKIIVIDGGEERQFSVFNGLKYLYDNGLPDETPLLVHDAVRPCLSQRDLNQLINFFRREKTACFLAEHIVDSIKKVDQNQSVVSSVDRQYLVKALTPQMANFIDLKKSYASVIEKGTEVTDDIGALTTNNIPVQAIIANDPNPKITLQKDLSWVKSILSSMSD